MDETIEKKRRNVIITSFIMSLLMIGDISFTQTINLLGVSLNIKSPEHINTFILIVGVYFLISFLQSLKFDDLKFKDTYYMTSLNSMGKYLVPIYQELEDECYKDLYRSQDELQEQEVPANTIEDIRRLHSYQTNRYLQLAQEIERQSVLSYKWRWRKALNIEDACAHIGLHETYLPIWVIIQSYAVSLFKTLFSKNTFEYHLPLFFGFSALIFFTCNNFCYFK